MNAPACRYCRSTIPIANDPGDVRCSGCGRDWVPAPTRDDASFATLQTAMRAVIRDAFRLPPHFLGKR